MSSHVSSRRSLVQRLLIPLVSAGVLAFATPIAQANSTFAIFFDLEYSSTSDAGEAECAVCHDTLLPSGSTAKTFNNNGYGAAIQANFDGTNHVAAMHAVDGADSDGEGTSNIDEINADAQPGWALGDTTPFTGDVLLDPDTTPDEPPVADAGPDVTGTVGVSVSFDGTGSTDDGTIVSYEWDFDDGSPTGTGATTSHTYTAAGSYTVTLTVTDDAGQPDSDTAIADISEIPNIPPTADPGGPYSGTVDVAVNFDGTASDDPDGMIMSYAWDFGDGTPLGTGPTPSHAYSAVGDYVVSLTVTDNDSASDTADTTAAIAGPDLLPPIADAGGPYDGVEDEPVTFNASGSTDPDGTIESYTWDFGDNTAPVTVTTTLVDHIYDLSGEYVATLTVTDNDKLEGTDTANVTILIGDPPPVADAGGPYTGTVGVPLQLDGTKSSDSGSGFIVSYDWNYGDGVIELDAGATPTHTYMADGPYTVTLTVTDDGDNVDSATADVTILPELQAPVADPGGPYFGTVGMDVAFNGSGSTDADGTIVEWNWDFGDSTTGTGETATHAYDTADTFTVTLTVVDDDGLDSSPVSTTATIGEPDQIPVADPNGPYSGVEGREVTFDGTKSFDPDGGDIVSYDWDFDDGNTGIGPNPTNVYAIAGTYTVTLEVTDDEGQISDPATTDAVIDMDEAPTALTGGPYTVQINLQPVTFDGSDSFDPDGVIVAWDWVFGDGDTGTGETTNHTYAAVGSYDVSLTVTDDFGNTGTATTTATITPEPDDDRPVADANGPYSALVGEVITFDGTGSTDPNGDDTIVSYEWDFGDGATGTGAIVDHAYADPGIYSVTLTVTDDTGLRDSDGTTATIEGDEGEDVFLLNLNVAKKIVMVGGDVVDRVVRVFADGTDVQEATVTLSADVPDGVTVAFDPQMTLTVAPGRPATKFFFDASYECEAKAVYLVTWTATIDAVNNSDPTNDTMQKETEVRCIRGARE